MLERLVRGGEPHRRLGRPDRPFEHLRRVPGLHDVVRDLGGSRGAVGSRLEGSRAGRVQPGALAREEVVVHGRPEQVVRERVPGALRDEEPLGHGEAQGLVERGVVEPRHPAQHPVGDGLGRDRGTPHDRAHGVGQRLQPADEEVGQGARDTVTQAAGPRQVGCEGRHEVGVAPGPTEHLGGDLGGRARVGAADARQGQVVRDLRRVERVELEPSHRGQPAELPDEPTGPGSGGQPVGADGRDDQQPLRGHSAQQEPEEGGRGRVDPLEVLDRQDHGAAQAPEVGEQGRGRVEDLQLSRLVERAVSRRTCGSRVQEAGERRRPVQRRGGPRVDIRPRPDPAEEVGHRQVGEARVAQVDALRAQDERVGRDHRLAEGPDQPGLADSGIPGDEDRGRLTLGGGADGPPQHGQLLLATHQRWRTGPDHDCMMAARPCAGQGIGRSRSTTSVPVLASDSSANAERTVFA